MKWGGGGADRSAVRPGAADRGLCGWQTPAKREGRGGAGHWQNTWASFWALRTLVTAVILHPAPQPRPQYTPSWEGLSVWCWRGGGVITAQCGIIECAPSSQMRCGHEMEVYVHERAWAPMWNVSIHFFFYCIYWHIANFNFPCLKLFHPWERNAIRTDANNYFYCPDIIHSQLWQPQRNGIKAILVIITRQFGLLLFSQHVLIPSWQKKGNECICIKSLPPFCLRCLHVPECALSSTESSDNRMSFTQSWMGNIQVCVHDSASVYLWARDCRGWRGWVCCSLVPVGL